MASPTATSMTSASIVSSSLATSPGNSLASATISSLTTIITTQTYSMASQGSSNIPGASITSPAYSKAKQSVISSVNQFVSNLISQAAESASATGLTTGVGKETGMPKGEKIGIGIGSAVIGLVLFGILGFFLIRRSRTRERSRFLKRSGKIRDHAPAQSTPNPYSGSAERPRSAFDNEEDEDFGFYGNEPGHSDAVELERRYRQDSASAPTGVWRNESF